jgi:Zn-dependent peptidase ImmA (M78 family)
VARADDAARDLLRQHAIERPPTPVEKLAHSLGLTVVHQKMDDDLSGMLLRGSGEDAAVIGVNRVHSGTRQRFTIAHELGHFLLHQGRPVIVDPAIRMRANFRDARSSLATDREEIEANQFAAEILMPAAMVRRELQQLGDHGEKLEQTLADRFKVSVEAMTYRLINLGLATSPH